MSFAQANVETVNPKRGVEYGLAAATALTVGLLALRPESLTLVVLVLLVFLAILQFDWFVYSMVFLLPWYPLPDLDLPMHDIFLFLRILMFVAVWILRWRRGLPIREWLIGGKIRKGILALMLITLTSLVLSQLRTNVDAYRSLLRLYSYIAFFYGLIGWIDSRRKVHALIKTLLISTIIVALFGFCQSMEGAYTSFYFQLYPLQRLSELPDWNGRITSFLFHFNSLAGYLNLAIPFAIGYTLLAPRLSMRALGAACLCASVTALYLTGSRGGMIAFLGIMAFSSLYAIVHLLPRGRRLSHLLVALVLAAILSYSLTPHQSEQAVRLEGVDNFTEITRLALWGSAVLIFFQHPVLGAGYGNFRALYHKYLPEIEGGQLDTHSIYLQFLAETGIIGFVAFFLLMWAFLRSSWKMAMQRDILLCIIGLGMGGAILGVLIHGLVDFLFDVSPQFGGLFWMVLAIGFAASHYSLKSAPSGRPKPGVAWRLPSPARRAEGYSAG